MLCILNIGKVTYNTDVHINGCTLPVVTQTRDLGSFYQATVHITDIVSKAHQLRAGLVG